MNDQGVLWFRSEHSQNNVWPSAAGVNAPVAVPDDAHDWGGWLVLATL